MMKSIKNRLVYILTYLLLVCLFLQGCTRKESDSVQIREYTKITTDLEITPNYFPNIYQMTMTDSFCYFVEEQQGEDNVHAKLYAKTLSGKDAPGVVAQIEGMAVLAFHSSKDTSGQDILCVLTREENNCVLTEYSLTGSVLKQFTVLDEDFVRANVGDILRCRDGIYVGFNANILYVFDDKGNVLSSIELPEFYFQHGMVSDSGEVYVACLGKQGDESLLAKVNVKTGALSEKITISGKLGFICQDKEGQIFFIKDKELCRLDIASQKTEKVLDLVGYNIFEQDICELDIGDEGIRILSHGVESEKAPIELIVLSPKSEEQIQQEKEEIKNAPLEKGKYDETGKRIITMYDPYKFCLDDIVETFNKNNDKYTVVVESGDYNVETRLAAKDSPDLLFSVMGSDVEQFQESGYLEDLTPYIKKSEIVSMEDLHESVVNYFSFEGGLYALPQFCSMETFMCLKSQVGERNGWTVEEFLAWLKENPNVKGTNGLEKWNILNYCLCGNMNSYVNFEKGTADLNGGEFKSLLEEVKSLKLDEKGYFYTVNNECDTEGTQLFNSYVSSLRNVAELEYIFGEQLVNMGYPCDSGEKTVLVTCTSNLSILSRSECKEGAFAFIEHYLTYDNQWRVTEPIYEGTLWTLKSRWNKEYEAVNVYKVPYLGENGKIEYTEFEITPENKEMVSEMLENAVPDTYEMMLIRDIIWEEAQPYFLEQKDLDTVCDIMQSRVSILLSERR